MMKYRREMWSDFTLVSAVVFLLIQLNIFAQPQSNGNDKATNGESNMSLDSSSWEIRDVSSVRVRLKLPPGYQEKQWAVVVGAGPVASFDSGHVNHIYFNVEDTQTGNPQDAKLARQLDYVDYKEWSQPIGGRKGVVQAFQGGGHITDDQGDRLPYCVEAITNLDGKHLLRISATLGSQERQREILAMLNTIEFY